MNRRSRDNGTLLGYYGYLNFGDDLFLYYIIKNIFPLLAPSYSFVIPIGGSRKVPFEVSSISNPNNNFQFKELYFDTIHNRFLSRIFSDTLMSRSKIVLYGGGTFLYEQNPIRNLASRLESFKIAKIIGKAKIVGLGVGIDPFFDRSKKKIAREIINCFDYVFFRDSSSLSNAIDILGNKILERSSIMPDLAYGLTSELLDNESIQYFIDKKTSEVKTVGINLTLPVWDNSLKYYSTLFREFISELLLHSFEVKFIIAQSYLSKELVVFQEIFKEFPQIKVIRYDGNIFKFLSELSKIDIFICSKFHLCVIAHILDKPFFAIEYQEKVRYLLKEIDYMSNLFTYKDFDILLSKILSGYFQKPNIKAKDLEEKLKNNINKVVGDII